MVDLTTIENEVEAGIAFAEKVLPMLTSIIPGIPTWLIPVLQAAATGVATVQGATFASPADAAAAVVDHLTPGSPEAPALK
jgi:hypothetical protein